MAYSDPQSLTVGESPVTLARTGSSSTSGAFRSSDQKYSLDIRHSSGTRERHNVKLSFADVVGNPLVPSQNIAVSTAVNLTIDHPRNGLTADVICDIAEALAAWATEANLAKLVGGEN